MTTKATHAPEALSAVGAQPEPGVGRPVPKRAIVATSGFAQVVDGPRPQTLEWDDEDEPEDQCLHCRGDGMDPDCDYLLPCPDCGGSW